MPLILYRYFRIGDHAGSDASPGVGRRCRFLPVTSMLHSLGPAPGPASRVKAITRPFGDQVGPSS